MDDVALADGPTGHIAWLEHGPAGGRVVIGLHGTPGGRHSAMPEEVLLERLGLRYLTFDRPGYGRSPARPGRTVASVVDDIVAVADAAGAEHFDVIGGSGGSAFALSVAALHPEVVDSVTLVVPTAPRVGESAMGTDAWFNGMNPEMTQLHQLAAGDPEQLRTVLEGQPGIAEDLDGVVDDLVGLHRDWGFDVRKVSAPTAIWFGTKDTNAPAAQATWLAEQLVHATLHPQEGDHAWPAERLADIFTAIAT